MARPRRDGIDYFPLDTHMEESVEFIEAKHGLAGFAVIIKIWQRIYSDKGYYCRWGEREAHLFAKKHGVEYDNLCQILEDCLDEGIFNRAIYEKFQILTSKGIQKRYVHASERRSKVEMELLLTLNGVSAHKKVVLVDTMSTETPQSIVKHSKGKEIKESAASAEETTPPPAASLLPPQEGPDIYERDFKTFWEAYPRKSGKRIGKADTEDEFKKLKPEEIPLVLTAVKNYAASKRVKQGWGIRDPLHFFRSRGEKEPFWTNWLEPEVPDEPQGPSAKSPDDESGIDYEAAEKALAQQRGRDGRG